MNLRDTTRKIISHLEEKSGYPVQIVEDKNLPVFASLRIARGPLLSIYLLLVGLDTADERRLLDQRNLWGLQ